MSIIVRGLLAITAALALAGCAAGNNGKKTPNPPAAATVRTTVVASRVATQAATATRAATAPSASATQPPASVPSASAAPSATQASAPAAVPSQAPAAASTQRVQTSDSAPCLAGQVKADTKSKIYHAPGQRDYARTRNNVVCFDTAAQAQAAGYRAAQQ